MEKILNYINGQLLEPVEISFLDNYNPSIGKVYSQIPNSHLECYPKRGAVKNHDAHC